MAASNIEFLGWQSDEQIRDLYRRCRCLVFPGEEDFGIVPVEAQACGAPVVAFAAGGVTESIEEDLTGTFFETQDADALIAADEAASDRDWDREAIRANAERFSIQYFLDGLAQSIYLCLADQN
jgi:glycosyltransferase involved in cell wall biosynthesis